VIGQARRPVERSDGDNDRPLGTLLREVGREMSLLVRQEVDLARAEIEGKLARLLRHGGLVVAGTVLLLVAIFTLFSAASRGLTSLFAQFVSLEVAVWLAPLTLALVLVAAGAGTLLAGLRALRREGLLPRQTTTTLQENTQWLKDKIRH
jgi:hypothetical protein